VACSPSKLGSCTTIVKLPQNNSKLLRGLASIKAVSLDIAPAIVYS
jgi:hypothetical protein